MESCTGVLGLGGAECGSWKGSADTAKPIAGLFAQYFIRPYVFLHTVLLIYKFQLINRDVEFGTFGLL